MADSLSVTSQSEDEKDIQPIKKIKKNPKKDEMKVFLRIRPQDNHDFRGPIGVNEEERCLMGISNDEYLNQRIDEFRGLKFNQIFKEDCSQDEFYNDVIAPILPDIFNFKKSSLIFAYGVTNSGKTHSILGSKKHNQNGDGILPRVLYFLVEAKKLIQQQLQQKVDFNEDAIFSDNKKIEPIVIDGINIDLKNFIRNQHNPSQKLQDINILFENFEIYNEEIFDLQTIQVQPQPQSLQLNNTFHNTLSQQQYTDQKKEKRSASKRNTAQKNKLKIKEKFNKKIFIKDLITNEVDNFEQINWLIKNAIENRQVRNNNVNQNSSRSQCCFKIRVKFTYSSAFHQTEEEASLLILDLAGAERAKKTNNTGSKMTESCHINKTLLCLGNCIRSLRNGDDNIPYRESKLTRILNEYFVDQNNVLMIVHIHPGISYTEENINVLKYAAIGLEAKLKAAATVYEGSSKYSFINDSAQKSMRNDKSIISNFSYDGRGNYRDYQSIDQDQYFPQIDNFANSANKSRVNHFTQSDQKSNKGGFVRSIPQNDYSQFLNSDDQPILDQVMNYEMSKAMQEKEKELAEKYQKEIEMKEVIQKQKRAIEFFDLQFENLMNEENNKLKLGQSLLDQFKIPDQIMYGDLTEDEVNQQHQEQIKRFSEDQQQINKREIYRISSSKFKNSSNKNIDKTEEKPSSQIGGGYQEIQQTFGKTPYQSQELKEKQNEKSDQVNSQEQESDHKFYIRDKNSTHSLRLNEEDMKLISQQNKKYSFDSQNSILNYKENIQIASNLYRDASNKYQQDEKLSSKASSINQKQIQFYSGQIQNYPNERNSQSSLCDQQIHQIRKNESTNSNKKVMIDEQLSQNSKRLSQNDSRVIVSSNKQMEEEIERNDQTKPFDMVNELKQNEPAHSSKKKSLTIKGVNVEEYIQEVYNSSAKKAVSEMLDDQSDKLLDSPKIYEEKDSESEHNKTAPNSINSTSNLDYIKRSPSLDVLSVSQQLIQLKQQQEQERENLQLCLENDEEEIKQYLELDLDENNLKEQILSQSQKLMQLIKDKEQEIEYQRIQFTIQQDNKNKEDQKKMKMFEEWIQQIQQELKIQQRFLEQKEVILSQQQLELATLQANLQEKYRIQQQQIQENLLASETMKGQIVKQEEKLREETERIVKLQQKIEEEMQMLSKEKALLGIQKNKSDEIKSKTATPYKNISEKKLNYNQMEAENPHIFSEHHVNFDLSNLSQSKQDMECENSKHSSAPRKLSGSFYPGHIPLSQGSSKQKINVEKSYAEKQIQTSAYRPAPRSNQNNQQNQSDVSVYTYYTYSEAESVNPSYMNNSIGSQQQNSAPNSQNSKENNFKNKNKNPLNQSQIKNKAPFSPQKENQPLLLNSSIKLCQQIQNQNNQMNLAYEEENSKKQLDKKAIEINIDLKNQNKILKEKQNEMVNENENDEFKTHSQNIQNEIDLNENQEGQEKKRQRGRKKAGQKQKKATSKERQESSSVDLDSTSKESESEEQEDLTNEEQLKQILENIDQQGTKNNKKKGRGRKPRDSLSSSKSRSSLSLVDSEASQRQQKKPAKQNQNQYEKNCFIQIDQNRQNAQVSKENNKRSASNSTNSRNGKKKNKNKNKK